MNIITIDPRPAQHEAMVSLLEQSAPVYGVEFTLPKLAHLLEANIDGQHNALGGKAAIEIALDCAIPPENVTYAVVRADADALGAIAVLEMRRNAVLQSSIDALSDNVCERVVYIAQHDAFQFGEWPGPRNLEMLVKDSGGLTFSALNALCMDFKTSIHERFEKMCEWLVTGSCAGLNEARAKIERDTVTAASDAEVVAHEGNVVCLQAHTMGATSIGYCYAPVVVIFNDQFRFPGIDGEHLKYTICQFQPGKYVDLITAAKTLNEMEQSGGTWGGSPAIIGSPQGVSSSLSLDQVLGVVQQFVK